MVMKDMNCWAKCCFELTDFGTHAAVSVVTKGDSDDANGCNLEGNTAWLQVCRVGNNFTFHYSVDGKNFYMMRYFHLPVEPIVKVGLLAQAPVGNGGIRVYEDLSIKNPQSKISEPENSLKYVLYRKELTCLNNLTTARRLQLATLALSPKLYLRTLHHSYF